MTTSSKNSKWIIEIIPDLAPPSLKDNTADADRLVRGIKKALGTEKVQVGLPLIRKLPRTLRNCDYKVRGVLYEDQGAWHLIDTPPAWEKQPIYCLALDLGSSTIVLQLLDLSTGAVNEERSFTNPQLEIGADILTRIHFADEEDGLDTLQGLIIDRLNEEIHDLVKKQGADINRIVAMAVAGNTTMTHLFLGLDPHWICREPYIPVVNRPGLIKAAELGVHINPSAPVLVFPNVGSYFGGDLIAGILFSDLIKKDEISLLVDVGTNAEVVIGNREWLMGCAGAAGPALEGGVAGIGMMAGRGVIDKVRIDPESGGFELKTIENAPPIGICGSGLIDLVAQLFLSGMIDLRGKYVSKMCGERLIEMDGIRHFVVVEAKDSATGRPLTLSQTDIDGLLRSKAAMYTILTMVVNTLNMSMKEISRFYVAGTFGAYIDPRSAIAIGMIPDLPLETYVPLGNSSLKGAAMALLSAEAREDVFQIRDRITYLELNVNQEFMNLFSAARFIPHTDKTLFPSVFGKEKRL